MARATPPFLGGRLRPPRRALAGRPGENIAEGITIRRVFDASRERIWREWTEPECFADWFGGSESEVPVSTVSMDIRPGGAWKATMFAGPERREIQWEGEYREVAEPGRLVFTVSDQPGDDAYELVSVTLMDLGDERTEMVLEQRGAMTTEQYERAGQGWSSFLDRMSDRLATHPPLG